MTSWASVDVFQVAIGVPLRDEAQEMFNIDVVGIMCSRGRTFDLPLPLILSSLTGLTSYGAIGTQTTWFNLVRTIL